MAGVKRDKADEEVLTKVGLTVKALRAARGVTQEALAEAIGHSQNQVWMVEKGKVDPGVIILKKIAEALYVPLFTLIVAATGTQEEIDAALAKAVLTPPPPKKGKK